MGGFAGQVIEFARYGGPDVLNLVTTSFPSPGDGEVVVGIRVAGVNPADWKARSGWRSVNPEPVAPRRLGHDAAGVVLATGANVAGLAEGDAVIGFDLPWSYATHVVTTPAHLVPKPEGVSFEEGAAIGVPGGTAYQVLKVVNLTAGETLLVHAGAGAVGQAAIQLGRHWGARVIATAGPASQRRLRELGAEPVLYGEGLMDRLRQLAPGGVDAVIDGAGTQEALETSLALTIDRQRVAEIVNRHWREEYGIRAFSASAPGYLSESDLALRAEAVPFVADLVASGDFQLVIQQRFPLADAAEAHRVVEEGHAHGKIVLIC